MLTKLYRFNKCNKNESYFAINKRTFDVYQIKQFGQKSWVAYRVGGSIETEVITLNGVAMAKRFDTEYYNIYECNSPSDERKALFSLLLNQNIEAKIDAIVGLDSIQVTVQKMAI